jgi:hypothetical protein
MNPLTNLPNSSITSPKILPPLFTAAILRFGLFAIGYARTGTRVLTQGDTQSYLEPGRNLLFHGLYTSGGLPEIDRTPGYPLFVMLSGMALNNVLLAASIQIFISLASLLLIHRIASRNFPGTQAGVIAAWLYAIEPLSALYALRLMPETLFILFLLIVIDRLLAFQTTAKLSNLYLAGITLAIATYIRPISYYLVFPLAIALTITSARPAFRAKGLMWKAPILLLATVLPLLAIWQIRNSIETGYSGFSSIVEKNLYFYQSAELTAELQHISLGEEQKRLGYLDEKSYLALHPEQANWTQAQRFQYMRTQSMQILSAHRLLYLKTHFIGVGVVAFSPAATELLQLLNIYPVDDSMPHRIVNEGIAKSILRVVLHHPAIMALMGILVGMLIALYALAFCGVFLARGSALAISTIAGIALYFLLISGGAQAVGRYRLPILPELCILAAGGIASIQKRRGLNGPAL